MRGVSPASVVVLCGALGACTEPPRPVRDSGRRVPSPTPAIPAADAMLRVVPVGPAAGSDVDSPADVPAVLVMPGAEDAAPDLTPEELLDIQFPQHALVVASMSPVYNKPDSGSVRLGYLRKGGRVRVGLKVERGRGCIGGSWYPLPEKGFVCSTSLRIELEPPPSADAPTVPDRTSVLPYRYGLNRKPRAFALTRLPTAEELALVRLQRDTLVAADEAAAAAVAAAAAAADAGVPEAAPMVELDAGEPDAEEPPEKPEGPAVVAREPEFEHVQGDEIPDQRESAVEPAAPPAAASPDAGAAPPPPVADAGAAEVVYSLAGPPPGTPDGADSVGGLVAQWLDKDFYVSIDRATSAAGERFYRTIRGLYVPASFVSETDAPGYHGLAIAPDASLPIGFVGRGRPSAYHRGASGRTLSEAGTIARQGYRTLRELTRIGQIDYWVTIDDLYVRAHNFSIADIREPPSDVSAADKWIRVDLSDQLLVAYEGNRPVYAALVSTGKENFETPAGDYRLVSKHVSATMDGITEADGAYSIEDVPWTMFFNENFAIHGAFWHNRFGMTKSHGCVNMSPVDAKWLFEWSAPYVPEGWHGVLAGNLQPGTVVVIQQ